MSTEFRCSECSNISYSATEETYYSCPYCGFFAEDGTLVVATDHLIHEQKKRTQLLKNSDSNSLTSKTSSTMQLVIQSHTATSFSLINQTASQGEGLSSGKRTLMPSM